MKRFAHLVFTTSIAVSLVSGLGSQWVFAQAWPVKPVRLVVPQPAGGPTDSVGRIFAAMLADVLGQTVIVENRTGAGGTIGAASVAKSKPDGYTLLVASPGITSIAPHLYPQLGYDTLNDFTHLALLSRVGTVLVVHPALPVKSVGDLLRMAKARPGQINMASGGNGTVSHLTGELFKSTAGVNLVHVPYKGSGPAATEVMAGQVEMMFLITNEALSFVRSNKLRALAVTGASRSPHLPTLPTVAEAGLPGFVSETWFGISGPAGMPADIASRVTSAATQGVQRTEWRERLERSGFEIATAGADEFTRHIRAEIEKWGRIVRQSGAKVE
ncbi:MAG: tripartite tricarboxylate transporter substrate binding protein [Proteobacteria bacterium]|nr:tripartite tricarboxylate transporter substrate binding protein [Burkholderiales bacterium]